MNELVGRFDIGWPNPFRIDVTLTCMMNLGNFPMDSQECPVHIQDCELSISMTISLLMVLSKFADLQTHTWRAW